jgi:hypothetical protein
LAISKRPVVVTAYVDGLINGQMLRRNGYHSSATIQGLNTPTRVVLADAVKSGDKCQIAIRTQPIFATSENFWAATCGRCPAEPFASPSLLTTRSPPARRQENPP